MGLDCSHDAFHGAYSAFNRLRQFVAEACGGSFPPHTPGAVAKYEATGRTLGPNEMFIDDEAIPPYHYKGISLFMLHSDCDGTFSPAEALLVAAALRWVAEHGMARVNPPVAAGHLARHGYVGTLERFAEGCERAAAADEPLVFA